MGNSRSEAASKWFLRISRETQLVAILVIPAIALAPVLFDAPLSFEECTSLILSMTFASLCIGEDRPWIERALAPIAIAFPLHLALTSLLEWVGRWL